MQIEFLPALPGIPSGPDRDFYRSRQEIIRVLTKISGRSRDRDSRPVQTANGIPPGPDLSRPEILPVWSGLNRDFFRCRPGPKNFYRSWPGVSPVLTKTPDRSRPGLQAGPGRKWDSPRSRLVQTGPNWNFSRSRPGFLSVQIGNSTGQDRDSRPGQNKDQPKPESLIPTGPNREYSHKGTVRSTK